MTYDTTKIKDAAVELTKQLLGRKDNAFEIALAFLEEVYSATQGINSFSTTKPELRRADGDNAVVMTFAHVNGARYNEEGERADLRLIFKLSDHKTGVFGLGWHFSKPGRGSASLLEQVEGLDIQNGKIVSKDVRDAGVVVIEAVQSKMLREGQSPRPTTA